MTSRIPFASPNGLAVSAAAGAAYSLIVDTAGSAGAVVAYIPVTGHLLLQQVVFWCTDTAANLRTGEWGLYVDGLDRTQPLLARVAYGTWSFTPAGAAAARPSTVTSPAAPVMLVPGGYYLVIRNTSATQVMTVARNDGTVFGRNNGRINNTVGITALGQTISLNGWTGTGGQVAFVRLEGRIGDESGGF